MNQEVGNIETNIPSTNSQNPEEHRGGEQNPGSSKNLIFSMVVICSMVAMQGMMVSGFLSTVLYQIEKQFGYSSTQSGLIHSFYDLFFGIAALLSSFFGAPRKMLLISFGALVMAIGSLSFIIPNYVKSYNINIIEHSILCSTSVLKTIVPEEVANKLAPLIIFCFSYSLIGIGASPLHTLGPAHLSEDVPPEKSGWYLSIMYFISALGPALGFFLSSPFLDIPNNLKYDQDIKVGSETWIGAWWIGYIICSVALLFIFAISINKYLKKKKYSSTSNISSESSRGETTKKYKSKTIICSLVTNKVFMLLVMGQWFEGFVSNGLGTFFTKFLEVQYHLSPSQSGMYSGLLVILGAAVATLFSGWMIKKIHVTNRQLIIACGCITVVSAISLTAFLAGCPELNIENVPDSESSLTLNTKTCLKSCSCSPKQFSPVCVDSTDSYFSPCHAGCTFKSFDKITTYHNCSCKSANSTATSGGCTKTCPYLKVIMTAGMFSIFMMFLSFVPSLNAELRLIRTEHSSIAMGIMQIALRISFILSPIVYGIVIDRSCKKQLSQGSTSGVCILYNNYQMRLNMSLISIFSKILASICYFTSAYFCTSPMNIDNDSNLREFAITSVTEFNLDGDRIPESSTLDV